MDSRGQPMYLHPRMGMAGQSGIGPVPGSIPINYHMDNPTTESMGMQGVQLSDNHAIFTHKTHQTQNKVPAQQHYAQQLPVRKDIVEEGVISDLVLPKAPVHASNTNDAHLHTKQKDVVEPSAEVNEERPSKKDIKTETDDDISSFMDTAHDMFLKIMSKDLTIKEVADLVGRSYSFVYSRYAEFYDKVTGIEQAKKKRKRDKTKRKGKKKRRTKSIAARKNRKTYQCDECPAVLRSEYLAQAHAKLHLEDTESHLCTACGILFPTVGQLMTHRIKSHEDAIQCPHCDKQFTVISSYKVHLKYHTQEKTFVCDVCNKSYYYQRNLDDHYRLHTGERPFMCGICESTFTSMNNLQTHHKELHTGRGPRAKNHACPECKFRTRSRQSLMEHMNTHTGAKPYPCEICGTGFALKANLKRHKLSHMGEKPYKCNYCPAAFLLKTDLERHDMAHTGNKPFKCTMCDYSCVRKPLLEYHMNTHTGKTPFKCDFYGCSAEYSSPATLKQHKTKHIPPPLKVCKVCNEKFPDMNSLKQHMMIHPGNKPLPCDQCDKLFYNESTLKRHMHVHMYKPPGHKKEGVVIKRRRNPGIKRAAKAPTQKKAASNYQVPVTENGHNSLPQSWAHNADSQGSQSYSFPASHFTNMVNNAWPSAIDPEELRHRLLSSFK